MFMSVSLEKRRTGIDRVCPSTRTTFTRKGQERHDYY
jgi:hypothetical protein